RVGDVLDSTGGEPTRVHEVEARGKQPATYLWVRRAWHTSILADRSLIRDSLRVVGQIGLDRNWRCGRVADRQQHVAGSRAVVDVPSVVAGERGGISRQHGGVVIDRAHVSVGVVVPEDGRIAVVRKVI